MLGPVAGVIGTLQATETVKEIAGIGDSLAGKLLIYDAQASRFDTVQLAWDPENPLNGNNPTIRDLSLHTSSVTGPACAAE